jgi:hypothetical protein
MGWPADWPKWATGRLAQMGNKGVIYFNDKKGYDYLKIKKY